MSRAARPHGLTLLLLSALLLLLSWLAAAERLRRADSDGLWMMALYRDAFIDGTSLSGWHLPYASSLVPELMVVVGLAALVGRDIALAYVLYGLTTVAAVVSAYAWAARRGGLDARQAVIAVVAGALALVALMPLAASGLRHLLAPGYHSGALLTAALLIVLSVNALHRGWRGADIALMTTALTGQLFSDLIAWPHAVLPALAGWLMASSRGAGLRFLVPPTLATGAAALLALGVDHIVSDVAQQQLPRLPPKPSDAAEALVVMVTEVGAERGVALLAALALVVVAFALTTLRADGRQVQTLAHRVRAFFLAFIVAQLVFVAVAPVLSGRVVDSGTLRYLGPLIATPALALAPVVAWRVAVQRRALVVWAATAVAVALSALGLAEHDRMRTPYSATLPYPPHQACIDGVAQQVGTRFAWSGYWQAKQTSLRSRVGLRVNQLTPDLSPYAWLSNTVWRVGAPPPGGQRPVLVLARELDPTAAVRRLPPPHATIDCGEAGPVLVYRGVR